MILIGSSQSSAAATVPVWVPKPISRALLLKFFLRQLADVELAALAAHVGEGGVADVAVVRPDDRLRVRSLGSRIMFSVSNMWVSRKFQLSAEPWYITR